MEYIVYVCEKCGQNHPTMFCPENYTKVTYYCRECAMTWEGSMLKEAIELGRVKPNGNGQYEAICPICDNCRGW